MSISSVDGSAERSIGIASRTTAANDKARGSPRPPRENVSICLIRSRARRHDASAWSRYSAALGVAGVGRPLLGENDVAHDARQNVVEVVGDTARQLADRLHLLRLAELPFEPLPFLFGLARSRDVAQIADEDAALGAFRFRNRQLDRKFGAVRRAVRWPARCRSR